MRSALLLLLIACKSSEPHHDEPTHHEDRAEPQSAPSKLTLDVTIDGTPATWNADAFAKVPPATGTNNNGESREVWSLRDLAHKLVGPTARVVSVANATGSKPIEQAAWDDATRIPILHTTRRGTLKYRWSDAGGKWAGSELNDVTKLEIVH
jgi:hypothetical protein